MLRQLERDTKVDFSLHCHRVSHTVTLQRESCIVRGWCGDVIAVTVYWYVQKGFQHRDVNVTLTATRQYSHVVEKKLAVYQQVKSQQFPSNSSMPWTIYLPNG